MKLILLQDVAKVGRRYEIKEVADGFARNFIIARNLGWVANEKNLKKLALLKLKSKSVSHIQPGEAAIKKIFSTLADTSLTYRAKANKQGQLFAGISKVDILKILETKLKLRFQSDWLILDRPIKQIGEYKIDIQINLADKNDEILTGQLSLVVEAED